MIAQTKPKKVVLSNLGGLDTAITVPWLIENYVCGVGLTIVLQLVSRS